MAQQVKSTLQEDSVKFQHHCLQRGWKSRDTTQGEPNCYWGGPRARKWEEICQRGDGIRWKGLLSAPLVVWQLSLAGTGSIWHRHSQLLALKQWDPSKYWKHAEKKILTVW